MRKRAQAPVSPPAPVPAPTYHQPPPAPVHPLLDYRANRPRPPSVSADGHYLVLPFGVTTTMPVVWQYQILNLLQQLHRTYPQAPWPVYRVTPTRPKVYSDLTAAEEAEAGVSRDITDDGQLVFNYLHGGQVEDPDHQTVLITCPDLLVGPPAPPVTEARRHP